MAHAELSINQKQTHRHGDRLVVAKGRRRKEWDGREFGVSRGKLLCLEWMSKEVLLSSTENYVQSPGTDHDGR